MVLCSAEHEPEPYRAAPAVDRAVNALPQKGDGCLKRPIPDGFWGKAPTRSPKPEADTVTETDADTITYNDLKGLALHPRSLSADGYPGIGIHRLVPEAEWPRELMRIGLAGIRRAGLGAGLTRVGIHGVLGEHPPGDGLLLGIEQRERAPDRVA